MCEVGNLIDLTPDEEPNNEEMRFKVSKDSSLGPYDPFESMEKEAWAKGMALKEQIMKEDKAHSPDLNEGPLLMLNAPRSESNLFERIILNKKQRMLSTESPLKLVEDDDVYSSLKFERDLQMLRIPFLDALSEAELEANSGVQRENQKINNKTEATLAKSDDPPMSKDMGHPLDQLRALIRQEVAWTKWHLFEAIIEPIAALIGPVHGSDSNPSSSARCLGAVAQKEKSGAKEAVPGTRMVRSTASNAAAPAIPLRRNSFATPSNPCTKISNRRSLLERIKTPSTSESEVKSCDSTRTIIPTQRPLKPTNSGLKRFSNKFSDSFHKHYSNVI